MKDTLFTVLEKFAEDTLKNYSKGDLQQAYQDLYSFYSARKQGKSLAQPSFTTPLHRLAYIICRMPATYAVIDSIFGSLKNDQFSPTSFLDMGCGSGAGLWAAFHHWPALAQVTAIDHDPVILHHAQQLLTQSNFSVPPITWKKQKIAPPGEVYDMILLSYVLNESDHCLTEFLPAVWEKCAHTLIIIEPGTPTGFQQCLQMRHLLINQGAYIIAPCGHESPCPLQGKQDWCHFEQPVKRLALQRYIKDATLGYENEAYSYLVASRTPLHPFQPRIIRPPLKPKGQIILDTCTPQGVERVVLTKRHPAYAHKKNLRWGKRFFNSPEI